MIFNFLFLIATIKVNLAIVCNYKCATCEPFDSEKCLSCAPTRILQNNQCICAFHHQELSSTLKSGNCFKCNENCHTCSYDDPNKCLSCGDPQLTNRILSGGKCECKTGYQEIYSQYNCINQNDKRIVNFFYRITRSNNQNLIVIQTIKDSDDQSKSLLEQKIRSQQFYDPSIGNQMTITNSQLNIGTIQTIVNKDTLNGEYFPYINKNLFVLAVKQNSQPQTFFWDILLESNTKPSSQLFQREVNGRLYYFNIFQHFKDQNLIIQMVITDGLPLLNRRILIQKRFLQEPIYYMQYFCLISYKSDSILGQPDLNHIINNFMNFLEHFPNCEEYEFDINGNGDCKKCQNYFKFDLSSHQCVCEFPLDEKGNCYKKCNNSDCASCVDNLCIKCSDITQNTCIECDHGYYQDGQYCVQCNAKCKTCNSANNCLQCANLYYQDNQDCLVCQSPCENCLSLTQCKSCLIGYYLSNDKCEQCSLSINKCIKCDNQTNCLQCQIGYYLDSLNKCTECPSGCSKCKSSSICTLCQDGNYLEVTIIDVQANCKKCPQYCTKCKNSSQCTHCIQGYFEKDQKCIKCDLNCKTCYGKSNECYSCNSGKVLKDKSCIDCKSPCLTCDTTDEMCTTCIDDTYYLNINNKCLQCETPCKTCTSQQHCLSCKNGYQLNTLNNRCILLDSTSTNCNDGYYMDQNNTCQICSTDCNTCQNNNQYCITCKIGYFLQNNQCHQCDSNCIECISFTECIKCKTQYIATIDKKCKLNICPNPQCTLCYSEDTCQDCAITQYVSQNTCLVCDDNCKSCNLNAQTCTSCKNGMFLDTYTHQCIQCSQKCVNCESTSNNCILCNHHYYLSNNDCLLCSMNCYTCQTQSDICTSCQLDQYLSGTQCLPCSNIMTGCNRCTNSQICTGCQIGYYFNTYDKSCIKCNQECSACISSTNCSECSNIAYKYDQTTCKKCPVECQTCTYNGSTVICSQCSDGYFQQLNNSNCLPCKSPCKTCKDDENNCLTCQNTGGVATNQKCQECKISNCKECIIISINTQYCNKCMPGYELKNNQCQSCTNNCICDQGYYFDNDLIKCIKCDPSCTECEYSSTQCTSCNSQQYLNNNQCLNCQQPCQSCTSSTQCTSCIANLQLINGVCQTCQPTCISCVNSLCEKCQDGYFIDSYSQCQTCKSPCVTCSSLNICLSCVSSQYTLINNQCENCQQPCQECDEFGCTKCNLEYNLKDNTCIKCSDNCLECIGYYSQGQECRKCEDNCLKCVQEACLECKKGYYQSGKFCNKCQQNCHTCNTSDKCTSCNQSYYLSQDQKCLNCQEGCLSCTNGQDCILCAQGYYLENTPQNKCTKCNIDNCTSCQHQDQCIQCRDGYYLKDNKCEQCSPGCLKCNISDDPEIGSSICLECDIFIVNFLKQENGQCILSSICNEIGMFKNEQGLCQKCIENCSKCSSLNYCDSCYLPFTYNQDSNICEVVDDPSPIMPIVITISCVVFVSFGILILYYYYKRILKPDNEIMNLSP